MGQSSATDSTDYSWSKARWAFGISTQHARTILDRAGQLNNNLPKGMLTKKQFVILGLNRVITEYRLTMKNHHFKEVVKGYMKQEDVIFPFRHRLLNLRVQKSKILNQLLEESGAT